MIDVTPGELIHRIWYTQWYLEGLYKESEDYAFGAEYPSTGLIMVRPGTNDLQRLAGFVQSGYTFDSEIDNVQINEWNEVMRYEFHSQLQPNAPAPRLTLVKEFYSNGITKYLATVTDYDDNADIDMYAGDYKFGVLTPETNLPKTYSWFGDAWRGYPSNRYTMRHSTWFLKWLFALLGDTTRSNKLGSTLSTFNFDQDIYMPMFSLGTDLADDFLFGTSSYADCGYDGDRVGTTLPYEDDAGGEEGSEGGYAYESKVCTFELDGWDPGLAAYLWVAKRDRLSRCLQAIHVLNKYDDPDHSYNDPKGGTTTPRNIAREMEENPEDDGPWNGHGINAYGAGFPWIGSPYNLASGVRTSVFAVLETLLGYKYYDTTSRDWADKAIDILVQVQWGVQRPHDVDGRDIFDGYGELSRPAHIGGCMGGWIPGSYKYQFNASMLDILNMPEEDKGAIPTNSEATGCLFQALRTYLHYVHGIDCPTSSLIP